MLPGPATHFSTADNPTAKSHSAWTRFLTFTYLPVFNFKLLLNPTNLSFDWGMDSIPRITTIFDTRNFISIVFYSSLFQAVVMNVKILKKNLPVILNRRKGRPAKKKIQQIHSQQDCVCSVCKQGLNIRHSSSCRAINNNNVPAPSVQCGCPPIIRNISPSPTPPTNSHNNNNSSPPQPTSVVILLSIALLTLPFLPATNLFFYVGFVVAERILYLPSVGYCLLVGLGLGKLMDSERGPFKSKNKKRAVLFCVCLVLIVYSFKTVNRNYDWRDEESLYKSAVGINPPKGMQFFNLFFIIRQNLDFKISKTCSFY